MQEDIINAVLQGKDTLALLPTGGGKSVCFQVPALLMEGLCIVITPLIALMKDQVEQLSKQGIQAIAIHSGLARPVIDILLDNCVYGQVKFLYVSPERLQTEIFIERVKKMNVSLIAVDEAHCISQWGYDFRPPYLQINLLRELKPEVPVIALTATATAVVRDDIIEKLVFRKESAVFQKSFARDNISFVVRKTDNKERKLLDILSKVKGSAIIYVRSRKATVDIAAWLSKKKISASFYHAGLSFDERAKRQDEWIQDKTRIMVATNAFGMGINKSNVRTVIHLDLPENLESYYQEAGRAGRDGLRSYAVILYQDADVVNLEMKLQQSQPSIEYLRQIYQSLANFYQLAVGSSAGESYDFDHHDFSEQYHYHPAEVYNALKRLEEEGLIQFNESYYSPSLLHIAFDNTKLYAFQVANAQFDPLIKMILRLFGGELFSGFTRISEMYLAKAMQLSTKEIIKSLKQLDELGVVIYQPAKDKPQVTFVLPRQDAQQLPINRIRLEERRKLLTSKMKAMASFVENTHRCRMQFIQDYFNETTFQTCGICDICIEKRKSENLTAFKTMREEVMVLLSKQALSVEQLEEIISPKDHELFVDIVREMVDEGIIAYDKFWRLKKAKTN
jgi:ATP-dependent DNA helicase RecQ